MLGICNRECRHSVLPRRRLQSGDESHVSRLAVPVARGGRRLEIIVDGLPLSGGAQFVVYVTLVSPLHCDGSSCPGAALTRGAVMAVVRRRKERTPSVDRSERQSPSGCACGEIGGRRSSETRTFVRLLAKGQRQRGALHLATSCGASVALAVGITLGVPFSKGFCFVPFVDVLVPRD